MRHASILGRGISFEQKSKINKTNWKITDSHFTLRKITEFGQRQENQQPTRTQIQEV